MSRRVVRVRMGEHGRRALVLSEGLSPMSLDLRSMVATQWCLNDGSCYEDTVIETQETVGRWADETFPGADPASPRKALRALEEMVELCLADGARVEHILDAVERSAGIAVNDFRWTDRERRLKDGLFAPDKVPAEAADVLITLYGHAALKGYDLHDAVESKMAVNRYQREWIANGDGTGYHKKKP